MTAPSHSEDVWLAAGVRTPFAKIDGPLSGLDAIAMSVPVVKHMVGQLAGGRPDFAVWGNVVPNLTWSNIAREILMDAGIDPTVPAYSTVMACSTSMMGVFEAAGMIDGITRNLALVGGVDSLSRIQLGLGTPLSDWIRQFQNARSLGQKLSHAFDLKLHDIKLYIPAVSNRTTGMSMGEHTEITAKEWKISREAQDQVALESHRNSTAAWDRGFFDDLVIPIGDLRRDTIPRKDTSLEKLARLAPAFDRTSGNGTLTAGNSSPLTDGASSIWVASDAGLARLPSATPRVKLIDWEMASVDFRIEGLLMAPPYAIPQPVATQFPDLFRYSPMGNSRSFCGPGSGAYQGARKSGIHPQQGWRNRLPGRLPARAHQPEWRQRRNWPSLRRDRRTHSEPGG
jgi:acetyl-CoA C-acetyltransferase